VNTASAGRAGYRELRLRAFRWRCELGVAGKVSLALGMAALTGLMAQVRLPLPFTPVPVTGQVFAVLLAGALLGGTYGGLSQAVYVALGAAGLPWFAGQSGGLGALTGVTGGYLVGFVPAAVLIGRLSERYLWARRFWPQFGLMMLGVGVIYACGALQLSLVLGTGPGRTLQLAVLPFVAVDVVKAFGAAALGAALLPKEAFGAEGDRRGC